MRAVHRLMAVLFLSFMVAVLQAQPAMDVPGKIEVKPYQLLSSGRQIIIKSTREIKHVMLWTTSGYRVVEQREINNNYFILSIPVSQKTFFLMIGLSGGKIYTEKIGIREAP